MTDLMWIISVIIVIIISLVAPSIIEILTGYYNKLPFYTFGVIIILLLTIVQMNTASNDYKPEYIESATYHIKNENAVKILNSTEGNTCVVIISKDAPQAIITNEIEVIDRTSDFTTIIVYKSKRSLEWFLQSEKTKVEIYTNDTSEYEQFVVTKLLEIIEN